ncbi:MAG: phosphoribosylanthranilate isomerase [Gemmatimonadaceae bacterium]|nr:phosphoribosylanthranilate isomerase [Gemmatimonadaceae bacterium]
MTRASDVAEAVACGARYVGGVMAGGPRHQSPTQLRALFAPVTSTVQTVGVLGVGAPRALVQAALDAGVDILQLHGTDDRDELREVRALWKGELWVVARVADAIALRAAADRLAVGDAVVLEAKVEGALGGTGVTLPWAAIADAAHDVCGARPLILAGGLRPENVAEAVAAVGPSIVDVSSGVESAAGIKDHSRMHAFAKAMREGSLVQ